MALARLTILALYDYDKSLFDLLEVPDGVSKEDVVNATLDKGSEFEVMYPDPDFMKQYIGQWSRRHKRMFQRWTDTLNIKYEPIRDYYWDRRRTEVVKTEETKGTVEKESNVHTNEYADQKEMKWNETGKETIDKDITSTESGTSEESRTGTNKDVKGRTVEITSNGKDVTDRTVGVTGRDRTDRDVVESIREKTNSTTTNNETVGETNNNTTEHTVSAYDANTYSPKDKDASNGGRNETTSGTVTVEGSNDTDKSMEEDITKSNSENTDEDVTVTKTNSEKTGEDETVTKTINEKDEGKNNKTGSGTEDIVRDSIETSNEDVTERGFDIHDGERDRSEDMQGSKNEDGVVEEKTVGMLGRRSYQELIIEELELAKFELVEKIADLLVSDICIRVY